MDEPEFEKRTRRARMGLALLFLAGAIAAGLVIMSHHGYPGAARDQIVSGCRQGGASRASCDCYIEHLEKEFTFDEYSQLAKRIPPPQVFADIALACSNR